MIGMWNVLNLSMICSVFCLTGVIFLVFPSLQDIPVNLRRFPVKLESPVGVSWNQHWPRVTCLPGALLFVFFYLWALFHFYSVSHWQQQVCDCYLRLLVFMGRSGPALHFSVRARASYFTCKLRQETLYRNINCWWFRCSSKEAFDTTF
jgi:hypothetical protein